MVPYSSSIIGTIGNMARSANSQVPSQTVESEVLGVRTSNLI